jgi:hypothetical protein
MTGDSLVFTQTKEITMSHPTEIQNSILPARSGGQCHWPSRTIASPSTLELLWS